MMDKYFKVSIIMMDKYFKVSNMLFFFMKRHFIFRKFDFITKHLADFATLYVLSFVLIM